nr:cold shock domain-containing protein [Falsirhodobacter deserti]
MTLSELEEGQTVVEGRVKWFDPLRGFGFVVSDVVSQDILLHANVLRNFGQSTVADGTGISVRVQKTDRGVQAVEVVGIAKPELPSIIRGEGELTLDAETVEALPMEPARIKWFDRAKGFGFANVFGKPDDVFVHVEVLRAAGLADIAPGEAVVLRIADGKRGRMAVQLMAWDEAVRGA